MSQELIQLMEKLGIAFEDFKKKNDERIKAIEEQGNALETAVARGRFGGLGAGGAGPTISTEASREHKKQFFSWMRSGDVGNLKDLQIQASLSTLSDPDAGWLVPVEIEKSIERLALASVAMRRLARIVKSKGEYTKPLSAGGATGGWVAEKASRPETDTPILKLFSPPMQELYAMPSSTQKLLDMSDFDVENWLLEEINDVFVATEGTGFLTGNGVSQVKGIVDTALMIANASWTYGHTGYIAGGHASLLNNADKLIDLQHALKPAYRQNGTWLMNDTTFSVIRKFKDGEGNYLWRPGLLENAPDTLLGKPVAIDDNVASITNDAYPIAFADFKRAYTIVDHVVGTRLLRDPYTSKGFVNFFVTKRIAAGISNYEAIKFMKIAVS